ncbi:hypothetical protein E6C70_13970 [Glaciibacter flavus]|uniref:Alpha/beta hydrolase n=1 Tax=Orlajensenia flava TaxID=2565934 RepID=A0A4S4FMW4_9MICO|nr:hypothetical protein [Glaciibacter flavus]THG31162.1 hypothetical protein E6C70_13970 [Glaciibacter flavus]
MTATEDPTTPLVRRRTIIIGAAAGLVTGALSTTVAFAAPVYSPVPKLPYEISRADTRTTRRGKLSYEAVDVLIAGDRTRIFVPHATPPGQKTAAGVLWLYHANGSDYTSIDGAYKYGAELAVDRGAVVVCPNYGGSLWTSQPSLTAQVNASKYMSAVWKIGVSFLRANSGGGSLMTYAYGRRMVPALRGMYLANATYDMEDLYDRDPRVPPVYGNSRSAMLATNPAALPQSSWSGARMKVVASQLDVLVPPDRHGVALANRARPVASDVIVQYHNEGHTVPGWTQEDMITTFAGWLDV